MKMYKQITREEALAAKTQLRSAGLKFNETPFAAYVVVADGCYDVREIAKALADGLQPEAGDTLTDAIMAEVSTSYPEFEVCGNHEWLRVYGGFEPAEDTGNDEYDEEGFSRHLDSIRGLFASPEGVVEFNDAKRQRIMCHGWNGAAWTHHNRGVATFDVLTESAEKAFDSI